MTKDELQFNLLKTELELTQRQMDKYDQLGATIKTWAVTLWAASLGWSFQSKNKEIVLLAIIIAGAFWMLDAVNKNFREDYKNRRDKVALELQKLFNGIPLPKDFVSPNLPAHKWNDVLRRAFEPHLFILYVVLVAVAIIIFLVI